MKYRVVLLLDVLQDIHNFSKIYTGLHLLARRGLLSLEVRPARERINVQFLEVTAPGRQKAHRVVFDESDHSTYFAASGLEWCDVYFKRSFYPPDLERLAERDRARVRPFGLNYPCATPSGKRWLVPHWLSGAARLFCQSPRLALARRRALQGYMKVFLQQPDFRTLEQPPEAPAEQRVLFQTRLWEPENSADDLARVNEERAALIRALRKALGSRFHGGVVPTAFARRHFPDVLLDEGYRRADYIRTVQRNLVGVYTRGLHHSLAFKLPEYLAASVCIVSEPLRNQLPQPLVAGRHYLEFRDHDECVAQCERLLRSPEEAAAMRRANHAYYRGHVAPAEHIWHCLQTACRSAADTARP